MCVCVYNVCVCVCVRLGCGSLDYRQQSQQMELKTGGMSVSTQVIPDSSELDVYEQVSLQASTHAVSLGDRPPPLPGKTCGGGVSVLSLCASSVGFEDGC